MELNIPPRYQKDLENVTQLLRNEGCKEIYLFGSLVTGKANDDSDIDIGIKGFPKGKFFRLYSKVYGNFDTKIDLVNFDADAGFHSMLNSIGEVVQIG